MRSRAGTLLTICAVAVAAALAAAPAASAVDIIESQAPGGKAETAEAGWQAGTCKADPCSAETPGLFFTQAAGHPNAGFTQIVVKHNPGVLPGSKVPVGNLKTVFVDLPAGLSVDPRATPQCTLEDGKFPSAGCPAASKVGESLVTVSVAGLLPAGPLAFPVYNIVPRSGEPARFGFQLSLVNVLGLPPLVNLGEVFLNAGVAWEGDYHEYFTIHVPSVSGVEILENRLVFDGTTETQSGGGRFLTNPSTCNDPEVEPFKSQYTTFLHADSQEEQAPDDEYDAAAPAPPSAAFLAGSQLAASPLPKGARPEGCDKVPFTPATSADPGTDQTDSPTGPTVNVTVPFEPGASVYQSNVKVARVTLPKGMGLNPSSAPDLHTCSDQQFGKGTRNPVACPANSKIGTVAIDTPVLPDGTLMGNVYLGEPKKNGPGVNETGEQFRVFLDAESAARGLSVRLVGNVIANNQTGQLTAVVNEAPQVPFDLVQVKLDGGPKATLTSPPTCGPNQTSHAMTAWSGTPDGGPIDKGFTSTNAPGGGACARSLGERPFSPSFSAKPNSDRAATYTPFQLGIQRGDGQQELKGIDITLPPGATAKLAGTLYCPPDDIAHAASSAGKDEMAHPSCPAASQVGVATVKAGSGSSPLQIEGEAYLAGRYKGAPLSLVVVTPAVAGPFDRGTVVVRAALFVDSETAQDHAVSDANPDVFGGAKLDLRSVAVNLNKREFTLNGTNCSRFATSGALRGGGSDPSNEAAFSSFAVSSPFQASGCQDLGFKPKLGLRLFGATKRAKHPRLQATLRAREGDANIGRASVALPHALFLDQASLSTICTRVQFAAGACPKQSVYGHAMATTPLLGKPLSGPVYLRSSNNKLPDLVAHLEGQVDIDLVGRIDSFHGGIRTTFDRVPDVPVSTFQMVLPGGRHGLLVNSRNLCQKRVKAIVQLKGQNGKKANSRPRLRTSCRVKKGKHHRGKHHGKAQGGRHAK